MKLQKCDGCGAQFSWRDINKSLWLAYRPITCEKCGTKHKVRFASRFVPAGVTMSITLLAMTSIDYYDLSLPVALTMVLVVMLSTSMIFPYLVDYRNE